MTTLLIWYHDQVCLMNRVKKHILIVKKIGTKKIKIDYRIDMWLSIDIPLIQRRHLLCPSKMSSKTFDFHPLWNTIPLLSISLSVLKCKQFWNIRINKSINFIYKHLRNFHSHNRHFILVGWLVGFRTCQLLLGYLILRSVFLSFFRSSYMVLSNLW